MKNISTAILLIATIFMSQLPAASQTVTNVLVDISKPIARVQPTMWGIFFEDINFAADGGLYAELVKNRSFEFADPMMGWKRSSYQRMGLNATTGETIIINTDEGTNRRYARIRPSGEGYSLTNEGFRGIGLKKQHDYRFSIIARRGVDTDIRITVQLKDSLGNVFATSSIVPASTDWKTYETVLRPTDTESHAVLVLTFEGRGVVDLDMVSLFPAATWKQRPSGLRHDLVQLLADLKPGFIRFPGGCIVEGRDLSNRYQWKNTVGEPAARPVMVNRWNTEFKQRQAGDYYQSFGLGFFEYFLLAKDLGAEPLPILNCGMACQFNTAEVVDLGELQPYIDDALDLIEFANGPSDSKWGSVRSRMGHPEPFNMKFIGVGNEQWGSQYIERYKLFADAIRKKYPDITIVSGAGPTPDGELFDYANKALAELNAELIDEHYYKPPEWFLTNAKRYDGYSRTGAKIFAGEYAAHTTAQVQGPDRSNWEAALAEAAFMTGLERNGDVVHLTSYAPLLGHLDAWQWTPNLIWFDNLNAYGTPSYYVQKLFSTHRGTNVLTLSAEGKTLAGENGLFGTAVLDSINKEVILKLVNSSTSPKPVTVRVSGTKNVGATATVIELASMDNLAVNSIKEPLHISPNQTVVRINGRNIKLTLNPRSLVIVRLTVKK
jgi:alpha-L-arabinofuranosidase